MDFEAGQIIEELINENLKLIFGNDNKCLHKDSFQENYELAQEFDYPSIIDIMVDYQLIETENDPDLYFPTIEGFEYENCYWEFPPLWFFVINDYNEYSDVKSIIENEIKRQKLINRFKYLFIAVITILFLLGINEARNKNRKPELSSEQINKMIKDFEQKHDTEKLKRIKKLQNEINKNKITK